MSKIYGQNYTSLTIKDACAQFGISRSTLNRWIQRGLPIKKIGHRTLVDPKTITEFIKKGAYLAKLPNS